MINYLRKLIRWEKSLINERENIAFWLRTSPGFMRNNSFVNSYNDLTKEMFKLRILENGNSSLVTSLREYILDLEKSSTLFEGDYISWIGNNDSSNIKCNLSIASHSNRDFDALALETATSLINVTSFCNSFLNFPSENLHSAFLADYDYIELQKAKDFYQYKYWGGLKIDESWPGEKRVDTSKRAGIRGILPDNSGFIETGASHYWFGELFYVTISKEKILKFKNAFSIEELPNGVIHVQLYENFFDSDKKENKNLQLEFKKYLGLI